MLVPGLAPSSTWIPFHAPTLPPGVDGLTLLAQVVVRDALTGQVVFGGSTAVVLAG